MNARRSPIVARLALPADVPAFNEEAARADLARQVEAVLGGIATALGLPAEVQCDLVAPPGRAERARQLALEVGGQRCRVTSMQLQRAHAEARGTGLAPADGEAISAWLAGATVAEARAFAVRLAGDALANDASVLLDSAAGQALLDRYGRRPATRERWREALAALLAQGISVQGLEREQALAERLDDPQADLLDATEALLAALRPPAVAIHLPSAELRRLTLAASDDERSKFALVRDGLFYEAGLRAPTLRFVKDESVPPGCFAFRVNDLPGAPWRGLPADQVLVNESADRLRTLVGLHGQPATNPASGGAFALVPAADAGRATAQGLMTWTPHDYLVLCLSVELRTLAPRLVDTHTTADELERLAGVYPALVRCARRRCSDARLTRVLRALLREGVSILNLRQIVSAIADFETVVADASDRIIVDDRLPVRAPPPEPVPPELLLAACRKALRRQITHRAMSGGGTLSVLLVEPEVAEHWRAQVEQGSATADAAALDRLLDALAAHAPAAGLRLSQPCLLTTVDARTALADLAATELPQLQVLAYDDLTPDASLSVAARITAANTRPLH